MTSKPKIKNDAVEYETDALETIRFEAMASPIVDVDDHITDIGKMVENLQAIADSLTDWDNPINAKSEIDETIRTLIDMQVRATVQKAMLEGFDKACVENDRMRERLEKIFEHTKIVVPNGYQMTGYYAMAMLGLGRKEGQ